MILHSTNGKSPKVSFAEGVANGLAPDGGLYMPDELPKLPKAFFRNISEMSLTEIAFVVCDTLFGDVLSSSVIKKIVDDAISFPVPLKRLEANRYVLELFHGPTMSFKDLGARFMAGLLAHLDPGGHLGRHIIVATGDDGGAAVADAFRATPGSRVFVLYPAGELSETKISRFSCLHNVKAIEVEGSFDDCQMLVKEVLRDAATGNARRLTSGNSINLARELPSIIYFFHAYSCAVRAGGQNARIVISVPCGNLGSLAAGLMAKKMGLPVSRFLAANNSNDVFVEYLKTGGLKPRNALVTMARAMDVGNPSNIARIIDLYNGDLQSLRNDVEGYAYTDEEIAETMRETLLRHAMPVSPQGATALRAMNRHLAPDETGVALMGAHPSKFAETFKAVTGVIPIPLPEDLPTRHGRIMHIPPTPGALSRILTMNEVNTTRKTSNKINVQL